MKKNKHIQIAKAFAKENKIEPDNVHFVGYWKHHGVFIYEQLSNTVNENDNEGEEYNDGSIVPLSPTGYPDLILTKDNKVRFSVGDEYFDALASLGMVELNK